MRNLTDSHGNIVPLGRLVLAQSGPHAGTWWRLDELIERDGHHLLAVSRAHRIGRHKIFALPEMFGLMVEEIISSLQHVANVLVRLSARWHEGLVMGAIALIPLAFYEAFHGGEHARSLLLTLLGAREGEGHAE